MPLYFQRLNQWAKGIDANHNGKLIGREAALRQESLVSSGDVDQVFVAWHGQTEWNRAGRVQGRLDSPLTELGEQQARRLARTAIRAS